MAKTNSLAADFDSPGAVRRAIEVSSQADAGLLSALDELPAAVYVTDSEGVITYFNPACIDFAGRTPRLRDDRWCVTWKLYTANGERLPHDQCPMATALKEGRAVRGLAAIAERPDGARIAFMAYPTPILREGVLVGAVNILIDLTDAGQPGELRAQADRCRRLARSVNGEDAETLKRLAAEFDAKAAALNSVRAERPRH